MNSYGSQYYNGPSSGESGGGPRVLMGRKGRLGLASPPGPGRRDRSLPAGTVLLQCPWAAAGAV